jgi:hypothetical protein
VWPPIDAIDPEAMVTREWLVTNGWAATRREPSPASSHGAITASSSPLCRRRSVRIVMLSHVAEEVRCGQRGASKSAAASASDAPDAHGTGYLVEFRLDAGLPVWRFDVDGVVIEKRLFMPQCKTPFCCSTSWCLARSVRS